MRTYLSNEHRKYMGLDLLQDNWEEIVYSVNDGGKYYLFFEGDMLKKIIHYVENENVVILDEKDVDYITCDNRTMVLPKTDRGKSKKITISVINSLEGRGPYFFMGYSNSNDSARVMIGNYSTQKSYYEESNISNCNSIAKMLDWCDRFVNDSTEEDLKEVEKFKNEKRVRIKYKEGDYFRVKIGRRQYTYGRILMDVRKRIKDGMKFWDIVMGKPLIIEMFHIITTDKYVAISELKQLKTFPSQYILDNNIYYGDYEIIGHDELPDICKYPIMYGKSISGINPNKIMFQCGNIYREIPYSKEKLIRLEDSTLLTNFRNSNIGYTTVIDDINIIEECIKENSNEPYWKYYPYYSKCDLRSPHNRGYLIKALKQFNLEYLLDIYNE